MAGTGGSPPGAGWIDVMIPAYGDGPLLREAIASVLAQDSDRWRLTVIDDGLHDAGLEAYLRGLADPRVEYRCNPVNLGINRNFQRCLEEARADLVVVMGADDRLLPSYVRTVLAADAEHPLAAWLHPGVRVIDDTGTVVTPLVDRIKARIAPRVHGARVLGGEQLAASLLRGDWMYFPSVAFRRELAVRHGFREGYDVVLDLDLFMRLLLDGGQAVFLDHVCFEYRRHAASVSSAEAVSGDRFDEELRYYVEVREAALAAGWPRAARAATLHLTSRLHALALAPAASRARDTALLRRLLRHAFGPTGRQAGPLQGVDGPASRRGPGQ